MTVAAPICSRCRAVVPPALVNTGRLEPCPSCGAENEIEAFPALFKPVAKGSVGEALVVDTHASCFYHPQKQAAVLCAACGRFICALCDVELEGQHLCPPCLETSQKAGKLKSLESRRTLYDVMSFNLALLSILFWFVSFITAPIALYLAIKHRKDPGSLLRPRRVRLWIGMGLSCLIILGWIVGIGMLVVFKSGR
jgi:hypothetical protein